MFIYCVHFFNFQPFSRAFDASSPPAVAAGNAAQFFFPPGAPVPYFQGGVAYYPQPAPPGPGDPNAQTPVYQSKFFPKLYCKNQRYFAKICYSSNY